jgi:hypothetical protein
VSPPVVRRWLSLGRLFRAAVDSRATEVSAMSPIRSAIALAPAPLTAPWRGGIRAVAALGAGKCKAMPPGHAVGARRKSGFPLRCVSDAGVFNTGTMGWVEALAGGDGNAPRRWQRKSQRRCCAPSPGRGPALPILLVTPSAGPVPQCVAEGTPEQRSGARGQRDSEALRCEMPPP